MAAEQADLIVTGATVHTAEEASPRAQAFAVRGGCFARVGGFEEVMQLRGPATEVLEARGHTVLPGLIDAHLHLTNLGMRLEQVDLNAVGSLDELVERTLKFERTSRNEWILGRGWDEHRWCSKALPTHAPLSAAIPDRPVALARVDGHALLVNARALAMAAIDENTPDPPGGRIVRDPRGKPTGLLVDAAERLVYDRVPPPPPEQLIRATRAAIAECNRWGITSVAEPGCDDAMLTAHGRLIEAGDYSIRNYAMLHDDATLIERHEKSGIIDGAHGGRLWVRAIKLYADGALGSRGAALLAPYSDDPSNVGLILTPRERIEAVALRAFRNGFQPCVHAIGDRANRMVLDAYEGALKQCAAGKQLRPRIEHAQVVPRTDIPRLPKLGVIPSMQAAQALSDMAWAPARLGERIRDAYPIRAMLDAGSIVANGTDAPVERADTRRSFVACIAGPIEEQRITRREALASMTLWAACANHQERLVGSIACGKLADFAIVDCDWMNVSPSEIARSTIVATYFAGRRVYSSPSQLS